MRAEDRMAEIKRDMKPGFDLKSDTSRGSVSGERRVAIHELTKEPPRKDRIGVYRREMPDAHRIEFERVAGELLTTSATRPASPRRSTERHAGREPIPPICLNRNHQRKEVVRLSHMLIGTLEVQGR